MLLTKKHIHFIFAHPVLISCALGAAFINATIIYFLVSELQNWKVLLNPMIAVFLVPTLAAATVLGFSFGMFFAWPFIRPLCAWLNGAPYKPEDKVLILSGVHKGKEATVCKINLGQGNWHVLDLNIADKSRQPCSATFEEYSVLRCSKKKTGSNIFLDKLES